MNRSRIEAKGSGKKLGQLLLFVTAVLALALLAFPGVTLAHDALDQQQTLSDQSYVPQRLTWAPWQSFTAVNEPLSKVAVWIAPQMPGFDLRAQIRPLTSPETYGSEVLGSGYVHITTTGSFWQEIRFSEPVHLTPGTQYALVVSAQSSSLPTDAYIWLWRFNSAPDVYSGGRAYVSPLWSSVGYDYCFKTYYQVPDTTPPEVTAPADITAGATGPGGATVTFSASASDSEDGNLPGSAIRYYTAYGTNGQAEVRSGDIFPVGMTTVTATATDSHGNVGNATFTISVGDTTPPALTIPADIIAEATGPAGAPVSFSVSATDLFDGVVTPQTAPVSGFTFPIGQTTVRVSAADSAGNISTASFLVTVLGPTGTLDKLASDIMNAPADPATLGGMAPGIKDSLLAKLNAALAALARGNKNDAKVVMNDLKALVNEVQAQTDKSISPGAAAAITAAANRLIGMLGAPPVPMTASTFVGLDDNDTEWQVHVSAQGKVADPGSLDYILGTGTISFTSWQSLPDGSRVQKAFTVGVDYYSSVDFFLGLPDAGAAVGICGPVISSTGGEGVPAMGDYYLFLAWDGAQGYVNPNGTVGHYPDTWALVQWDDDPLYMRSFQRTILTVLSSFGRSYRDSMDSNPETYMRSLWPVTAGDIAIIGGAFYPVD